MRQHLTIDPRDKTNLLPLAIGAIKSLDQLGKVKVQSVGSDSNNRAIFVVKLLDLDVIASFSDHGETPKVGPALITELVGISQWIPWTYQPESAQDTFGGEK